MDSETIVTPAACAEEAAAIAAALARFTQEAAAPADSAAPLRTPWQRAALQEGVDRTPTWG